MTDVALRFNAVEFDGADLVLEAGVLSPDDGLETAIAISLFTDARAADDDVLPDPSGDRRGWWGDVAPRIAGDAIGSRLWLLAREKKLSSVVERARGYAAEALAWLIEDGIAAAVEVTAEAQEADRLAIGIVVTRPGGDRRRYDYVWGRPA